MTIVYFVRHAEPNYNNHDDMSRELSDKGLKDRKLVSEFLADKDIDIVISSPYNRTEILDYRRNIMPLPMVHLSTAVKINTLKTTKSPEFYLGSISPDAVHMRTGFVGDDKTRSHCNARVLAAIDELDTLCVMIEKSMGKEREFLLGYLVHILTDLFWEDTMLKTFWERYEADPSPIQDKRMGYYNDTDQLDFAFYEKESWRPGVWEMLTQAEDFSVEEAVNKDEVAAWKHRTLNWYNSGKSQHTNPIKYISYEDLDSFTSYAAEKCDEYLWNKGLGE